MPVTLVILVFAFGALVAAGIPLLLGMTAVAAALGLTALLSHLLHVDESINEVILLIGLAVGVDYSLFYLRRDREERARGRPPAAALQVAAATSGRAVLISGLTVMTAMAGMFLMGSRVFSSFGVGTMLVVAIAVVGSLTVLPAVLSKLGDRVDRGRIPFLRRRAARGRRSRVWATVVGAVLRQPVVWGGAGRGVAGRARVPAFPPAHRQLGRPGAAARPAGDAGLRPHPEGVPRRADARRSSWSARRTSPRRGHRRDRRAEARRAGHRPDARADQRRRQRLAPGGPGPDPARRRRAPTRPRTARSTRCAAR